MAAGCEEGCEGASSLLPQDEQNLLPPWYSVPQLEQNGMVILLKICSIPYYYSILPVIAIEILKFIFQRILAVTATGNGWHR
jgi:hypothetical protein